MGYGNTYGKVPREPRPYRTVKNSAASYDNHALAGAKFFGPTMTGDVDAQTDEEYGLPFNGPTADMTPDNVDGNAGFKMVSEGPGITASRKVAGSNDPTPGGGWG